MDIPIREIRDQIDGLEIVQPLPGGGQKVVLLASHPRFGRVVLKLVRPGADPERAYREVYAVSRLGSRHVPEILQVGVLDVGGEKRLFLIEAFVEGRTLRDVLRERAHLTTEEVLELLDALLCTATDMETRRLVHRDIKPENIMYDTSGRIWLLDFGICRHLDLPSVTDSDRPFGPHTPGYAAPEQFRNVKREIDVRADLFSIGVVAYESISGRNPFREGARDPLEVLYRTETVAPDPLKIEGDSQGQLSGFIGVLCDRRLSRRPRSAAIALAWLRALRDTVVAKQA